MYQRFADIYDTFMDNVPYDEWTNEIKKILSRHNICEGTILDMGCGTGAVTERLAESGYSMIGLDVSEDMLSVAYEKMIKSGYDIMYINQDMCELDLGQTVDAIICCCDSINYITEDIDLKKVFDKVGEHLEDSGIFIFDFNTDVKYAKIGDSTIAENRDDASFIWENTYYEEEKINECALTIYAHTDEKDMNEYHRYDEIHVQRGYTIDEIAQLISESGLYIENITDISEIEDADNGMRKLVTARKKAMR